MWITCLATGWLAWSIVPPRRIINAGRWTACVISGSANTTKTTTTTATDYWLHAIKKSKFRCQEQVSSIAQRSIPSNFTHLAAQRMIDIYIFIKIYSPISMIFWCSGHRLGCVVSNHNQRQRSMDWNSWLLSANKREAKESICSYIDRKRRRRRRGRIQFAYAQKAVGR